MGGSSTALKVAMPSQPDKTVDPDHLTGSALGSWPAQEACEAEPALGDILRQARGHRQLTLRQVEQRISLPNAHLSQIERGSIRRPDPAILMDLAEERYVAYRREVGGEEE